MYARAMDVISFIEEDGNRIESYEDKGEVAKWAYSDVNRVLNARVFNGSSKTNISPLGTFTYAEAATAIRNLLLEAELIKD